MVKILLNSILLLLCLFESIALRLLKQVTGKGATLKMFHPLVRTWMTYRDDYESEENTYFMEYEITDPYADLLNLSQKLEGSDAPVVLAESTIDAPSNASITLVEEEIGSSFIDGSEGFSMVRRKRRDNQPEWLRQMNIDFGPWDAELGPEDAWLQECRNIVEENSGRAIWSQRSSDELRRAKRMAPKKLQIPKNVELVVNAVYIERSHRMYQLKQEQEFAVKEYRKWMSEKKKEMKKEPLPIIKAQLAERWLQKHPNTYSNVFETVGLGGKKRYTFSQYEAPVGVLDEITDIIKVRPNSGSDSSVTAGGVVSPSQGSSKTALNIPSIINWDKQADELLNSPTNPSSQKSAVSDNSLMESAPKPMSPPKQAMFKIDDEEMFVANNNVDGYFVVL